jgi:hypothetical protein
MIERAKAWVVKTWNEKQDEPGYEGISDEAAHGLLMLGYIAGAYDADD